MKLSIIVPVYNAEKWLVTCLESIFCAMDDDYEIILIDDGSTDRSGEICDRMSDYHDCIKVIHQQNRGVSAARNEGIKEASGEWLTFVDNDDLVVENGFSCIMNLTENTDADLIQGGIEKVYDFNDFSNDSSIFEEKPLILPIDTFADKGGYYRTNVWGKLYKTKIAKEYLYPVGRYGEDIYFNGLYFCDARVKSVAIVNRCIYLYRINPESASHNWQSEHFWELIETFDELYQRVKDSSASKKMKDTYLKVFYIQFCSAKYNLILRNSYDSKKLKRLRFMYLMDLYSSTLPLKEKLALSVMSKYNLIYRKYILHTDKTMYQYERNIQSASKEHYI